MAFNDYSLQHNKTPTTHIIGTHDWNKHTSQKHWDNKSIIVNGAFDLWEESPEKLRHVVHM